VKYGVWGLIGGAIIAMIIGFRDYQDLWRRPAHPVLS
jgi:hypothetical protein